MIKAVLQEIYFQGIFLFLCTLSTCGDLCYATALSPDYSIDGGKVVYFYCKTLYLIATIFNYKDKFNIAATCTAS
jgi:hypothetical protein